VAAYLRGDAGVKPSGEKVLEKLTLPQAATLSPAVAVETAPQINEQRLEQLTKVEPTPAPSKAAPVVEEAAPDLSKADEKLSSLLGGKQ
jgi:hypothetical protein